MAWLSGWSYRKAITLSRASGAVSNYQMKLLVGESSGATGESVDCAAHVKTDFSDLRFTAADGSTLLDYWIESVSGATPNQLATVWIEFGSIGTGATTFYMYYGNAGAAAVSNGTTTFLLFDHFDDASVSSALWNLAGTPTESGTTLTLNGNQEGIYSKTTWTQNVALRAKAKLSNATSAVFGMVGFRSAATTPAIEWVSYGNAAAFDTPYAHVTADLIGANQGAMNTEHIYDLAWISDRSKYAYDNGAWVDLTTQVPSAALPVELMLFTAGAAVETCDWIFVRQYLAVEPAWGSWGEERAFGSTLSISPGAFSVNGTAVALKCNLILKADPGSYGLTGNSIKLMKGTPLVLGPGSFSMIGSPMELRCGNMHLDLDPGSFSLVGKSMSLPYSWYRGDASANYEFRKQRRNF